jgi:solute carrier family 13 (sodium-dependent dicarboxylate transporter), member 2/3/5
MFPVTIMCSGAFHLPVGTPPNAIVSAEANIRSKDMAIAGIGPSVIFMICVVGIFPFWQVFNFAWQFFIDKQ